MSMRLRGIGPNTAPVDDAAATSGESGLPGAQHHRQHHHVHQTQKSANRSRMKRRRGADSQDGIDESGASEELLMMLTEHLQKQSEFVMRVADRHPGEHTGSGGDSRDRNEDEATASRPPKRLASAKRFMSAANATGDAAQARETAESTLLRAREEQASARPPGSSTYLVLAAVRDFLLLPGAASHASGALASIRQRLIDAVAVPTRPAPAQQQSMNLLLPLMLLNLERSRTDTERALAVAKISSLLDRRRSRI